MNVTLLARLALLLLLTQLGCSFIVNLDPDKKPCGPGGTCLRDFTCNREKGVCEKSPGACGTCAESTKRMRPGSCECVTDTCENRTCPAGTYCVEANNATSCVEPSTNAELGYRCSTDAQCGTNRYCYRRSVPDPTTGGVAEGICVEKCTPNVTTCSGGAKCTTFSIPLGGTSVSFCVGNTAVYPSCTNESQCSPEGLTCAVFDHPSMGPGLFCDTPNPSGGNLNDDCSLSPTTGQLCRNGLCAPPGASGARKRCAVTCDGTCPTGYTCTFVENSLANVSRWIPMCVADPKNCAGCRDSSDCSADATDCVPFNSTPRCLRIPLTPNQAGCPPGTKYDQVEPATATAPAKFRCRPEPPVCVSP